MALFEAGDGISIIGTGADELCSGHEQIRDLFRRSFEEATAYGRGQKPSSASKKATIEQHSCWLSTFDCRLSFPHLFKTASLG